MTKDQKERLMGLCVESRDLIETATVLEYQVKNEKESSMFRETIRHLENALWNHRDQLLQLQSEIYYDAN